jgi:hypothetical protein
MPGLDCNSGAPTAERGGTRIAVKTIHHRRRRRRPLPASGQTLPGEPTHDCVWKGPSSVRLSHERPHPQPLSRLGRGERFRVDWLPPGMAPDVSIHPDFVSATGALRLNEETAPTTLPRQTWQSWHTWQPLPHRTRGASPTPHPDVSTPAPAYGRAGYSRSGWR